MDAAAGYAAVYTLQPCADRAINHFAILKQNFKPDAIQVKLSPRLKVCEIL